MRLIARGAMIVLLSLVLPSEGEAQLQQRSLLADVVEAPSAREAALVSLLQPGPCRGTLASAAVGGAVFGALIGALISFFVALRTTVNSMGHERFNGTPLIVGGAVLFGFLSANSWQRRCGMTDGVFP